MLLVREAFKNASEVIVYIPRSGTKASGSGGGLTASAAYGGTRGNDLKYSVSENPVSGFDVTIYLGDSAVELFEGISSPDQLKSKYIEFAGGTPEATAGVTLSGGTDAILSQKDYAVSSAQSVVDSVRAVFDNSNIIYSVSESSASS